MEYVQAAVASGELGGGGAFTARCERLIAERLGVRRALLTNSCSVALEMASLLGRLGPGDEAIVPCFTFPTTATSIVRRGARPVLADVRQDTLNLDESRVEAAVTPRTRAIFVVHYAGVACDMEAIGAIARRHRLLVVEDCAQAIGAAWRGRPLGSIGDLGALSFHQTKNVVAGEGGALCVGRADLVERAEFLRDKGTDRARFLRGEVARYSWVDAGSGCAPSEMVAAFLLGQIERADAIHATRAAVWRRYFDEFEPLERAGLARRPVVPPDCATNHHGFHLLLPDEATRDALGRHFRERGIGAVMHYVPLHLSPMGRSLGYAPGDFPVAESVASRLLRLPVYGHLDTRDQDRVIECAFAFLCAT